ncbi:hypothetical protein GE09DRAFT_14885 [Coniochaeta sp. 2T2.1]|nr:hypothetical protein GE09DRAFT_14885 [Coniochaeta sp. 2T2.1]
MDAKEEIIRYGRLTQLRQGLSHISLFSFSPTCPPIPTCTRVSASEAAPRGEEKTTHLWLAGRMIYDSIEIHHHEDLYHHLPSRSSSPISSLRLVSCQCLCNWTSEYLSISLGTKLFLLLQDFVAIRRRHIDDMANIRELAGRVATVFGRISIFLLLFPCFSFALSAFNDEI